MWVLAVVCAFMIGMAKTGIHALGFAGIVARLFTGKNISAIQFKHLIGILVIASLLVMIWLEIKKTRNEDAIPHKVWFAVPFGIMGGFSTMIGNAAGYECKCMSMMGGRMFVSD